MYGIAFLLLPYTRLKLFNPLLTLGVLYLFIDNMFVEYSCASSAMHLFFLKLNSDNNLFLMFLYVTISISVLLIPQFKLFLIGNLIFFELLLNKTEIASVMLFKLSKLNTNTDLTDGLLLIHPLCLYTVVNLVFLLVFKLLLDIKAELLFKLPTWTTSGYANKRCYAFILLSSLVAIFLGSWWAQLELSWGGWWGWDFIELVSLNYMFFALLLIHQKRSYGVSSLVLLDTALKVVIYTLVVKFSYLDSIHNFASVNTFLQNFFELFFFYAVLVYTLSRFRGFQYCSLRTVYKTINTVPLIFTSILLLLYAYLILEFLAVFFSESSFGGSYVLHNKYLFIVVVILLYTNLGYYKPYSGPLRMLLATLLEQIYFLIIHQTQYFRSKYLLIQHLLIFTSLFFLHLGNIYYSIELRSWACTHLKTIVSDLNFVSHEFGVDVLFSNHTEYFWDWKNVIDKVLYKFSELSVLSEYQLTNPTSVVSETSLDVLFLTMILVLVVFGYELSRLITNKYLFLLKWGKFFLIRNNQFLLSADALLDTAKADYVSESTD